MILGKYGKSPREQQLQKKMWPARGPASSIGFLSRVKLGSAVLDSQRSAVLARAVLKSRGPCPTARRYLASKLVATVNSQFELTVGSSSKEKPTVTRALTVATPLGKSRQVTKERTIR
jgi:hypothetical protein